MQIIENYQNNSLKIKRNIIFLSDLYTNITIMATYKKRGYKKPKKKNKNTAEGANQVEGYVEGESSTEELFENLDEGANKIEDWITTNQKMIFTAIGVAALCLLAYVGYQKFVQEPNEINAANDAYMAKDYFVKAMNASGTTQDSLFNLALNGVGGKLGLVDIASIYSGTKAGNLANYAAGMAYLNMNDYKNAVTHLDNFTSKDEIFGANAKGAIGDAYTQLHTKKNPLLEDALDEYKKALAITTNSYTTPKFLYKAAIVALSLGKNEEATKYLNQIKNEYSKSLESSKIDALLGKAQAK